MGALNEQLKFSTWDYRYTANDALGMGSIENAWMALKRLIDTTYSTFPLVIFFVIIIIMDEWDGSFFSADFLLNAVYMGRIVHKQSLSSLRYKYLPFKYFSTQLIMNEWKNNIRTYISSKNYEIYTYELRISI